MNIPDSKIKQQIFELFFSQSKLKFNEIEKQTKVRSNLLTFYLKNLIKDKILQKSGEYYTLTLAAEKMFLFYRQMSEGDGKLPVMLVAIRRKDEILLLQRDQRPYKGYFSLPGKKMCLSETIQEAAIRCAKEETHLDVRFKRLCGVVHERLKEDNAFKHSFIFFICLVEPVAGTLTKTRVLKWVGITQMEGRIIPSDIWMIKKMLKKTMKIDEIVMEENDGELRC